MFREKLIIDSFKKCLEEIHELSEKGLFEVRPEDLKAIENKFSWIVDKAESDRLAEEKEIEKTESEIMDFLKEITSDKDSKLVAFIKENDDDKKN
ncbi:MAG: hypothetical protein J6D36_01660 [Erysipelotrichaceae bacterium]|nr:hypothetical protein [Erysipelotrichaceae bacterium]